MKHILSILAVMLAAPLWAANISQTVEQVTTDVVLTTDVDYHISSTDPFTTTGSIDIVNTDHAVIIFDNVKPSKVISSYLTFIKINGEAAVNESNCQVRIYNLGAIVFPYGKESSTANGFHPLTVFSETSCKGETCNLFGLENNGGFMMTLPKNKLRGQIRSFSLKRGYMVTFSLKDSGYGYSRCFIADKEDLVVNTLPAFMDKRICSYRIFRWNDVNKRGYSGSDFNYNKLLNTSWAYGWNADDNRWEDIEYVTQHHHEGWPSIADVGRNGTSAHALGNNEPDNKGDEREQDVDPEVVLKNWPEMMRTGKRLGSPAMSGNKTWLRTFINEIDARGWRVDFIAVHDYNLNGKDSKIWNVSDYRSIGNGRPVWLTEMNYGANWTSWPGSNTAGNAANYKIELDNFGPTIDAYNNTDYVERYAVYNWVQDCRKVVNTDDASLADKNYLTPMGEYYAGTKPGLAFNRNYEYIPKAPALTSISDLAVTQKKTVATLTWTNENGNLTDMSIIQEKQGTRWVAIDTLLMPEAEAQTYTIEYDESTIIGLHTYRIVNADYDGKRRNSNEASFFQGGAYNLGEMFVGQIEASNTDISTSNFAAQETVPVVFTGMPTYKNSANGVTNHVTAIAKNSFKFCFDPWTETLGNAMEFTKTETTDYVIMRRGNFNIGGLSIEVDTCGAEGTHGAKRMSKGEEVEVKFKQPFPEGVVPIVLLQNVSSSSSGAPATPKVYNITNTGFTMKLVKQAAASYTKNITAQYVYYLAITPGEAFIGETGKKMYVGRSIEKVGGNLNCSTVFRNADGDTIMFQSPYVIAGAQTNNLDYPSIMRRAAENTLKVTGEDGNDVTMTYGIRVRRQMDPSIATSVIGTNTAATNGDEIGWIVIADAPIEDGINEAKAVGSKLDIEVRNRAIYTSAPVRIFTMSGVECQPATKLPTGIYLVTDGVQSQKVYVK